MIPITRNLINNPVTRPALRPDTGYAYKLRSVKGVIAHWTANQSIGADSSAHARYFQNGSPAGKGIFRAASAHYVVDDHSIIQCIPENEAAYHCGDTPKGYYMSEGKKMLEGEPPTPRGVSHTPNLYTIGFEMCVNADGVWERTYANSVELAALILLRHNLNISHLYRHFDITSKPCPNMFIDLEPWERFLFDVAKVIGFHEARGIIGRGIVNAPELNVRERPGVEFPIRYKLAFGEPVLMLAKVGNWVQIGEGEWINFKYVKSSE